jgi:hypothetical protein
MIKFVLPLILALTPTPTPTPTIGLTFKWNNDFETPWMTLKGCREKVPKEWRPECSVLRTKHEPIVTKVGDEYQIRFK